MKSTLEHPLPGDAVVQRAPARERRRVATVASRLDARAKRLLDMVGAALLLIVLLPLFVLVAAAVKLDSRGPVFYRCRRVGLGGREFAMVKFRKMRDDAAGPPLTIGSDSRFTRVGRLLARTKLDELPQLWNVLRGDMSLVGPRPEDVAFVAIHRAAYDEILRVRPGISGLSQLAFAREADVLDERDAVRHYVERLLPQKVRMDILYARRRSLRMDARILFWTLAAVVMRRDVAVHRGTGELNLRRRPKRGAEGGAPAQVTWASSSIPLHAEKVTA